MAACVKYGGTQVQDASKNHTYASNDRTDASKNHTDASKNNRCK